MTRILVGSKQSLKINRKPWTVLFFMLPETVSDLVSEIFTRLALLRNYLNTAELKTKTSSESPE